MNAIDTLNRREEAWDTCALTNVKRLAALLNLDPAHCDDGQSLPLGWQVILFPPLARQADLGPDGHPEPNGLMPSSPLPRRVHGGRRVWRHSPVRIGEPLRRVSEIAAVRHKNGRSGPLMIVTVRHAISRADLLEPAIVEEQDIIYRGSENASEDAGSKPQKPEPRTALHQRAFRPTTPLLFRFSAVTFNAHRIHYDQSYATQIEGYPSLVVNGGLTALFLLQLFRDVTGQEPSYYEAKNLGLLFCDREISLCVAPLGEGWRLWAEDQGRIAIEVVAK
ncbi:MULTISPECIES: MaoC family dehydratase N-terminal domain-containing protein [unclassified Beijerinckia]|uniref:FAS1-like dehydratase domain-containing protein n=1 Tax=unclassified Beijerinckia TaxID=2638183 RepID=UPI00089A79E5|nr:MULTISPECIES: MaoC family dehydratase N-terminal domain-containing protein [unclassified Beijerinckia]MDH7796648.1 3-methylfumaryl-CoA hydratase [Beijerinckia sp. GAS462]SEC54075.1 3-methylfumaryl-CoA hydratase [Beijerinckia sp. 28-YEA-48]